ncbi:DUF4115 domain-containing protein [Shewanella sp. JM162201]|uniref:DUF4115 domain-containing protein n=1 Tax=Shewanella jiangmenensis TaxID=2837387 RepID=A0ABS5V791_9GAMM|nr:RodZ domain-containing protein [Shewanella jiangmenensis]MBT1444898.1 DUF4115 domain-containing protein [Shewanella jiangmenensis]
MNEELNVSSGATQEHAPESLGQILKAAREAKNLSVADVATALHLRPSIVTNIEADDFSHIANATYIRGYVKNFARIVEADKQKVAQCLERQAPVVTEPTMQSFSRKTVRQARDTRYHLLTWLVLIGLLVLMVFWWLQTSKFFNNGSVDFSKPTVEEVAAEKVAAEKVAAEKVAAEKSAPQLRVQPADTALTENGTEPGAVAGAMGTETQPQAAEQSIAQQAPDNTQLQAQPVQTVPAQTGTQATQTAEGASVADTTQPANVSGSQPANQPMTAAEILAADAELRAPKQAEAAAQVPAVDDGMEDLRVTFSADCWIQVKDGDGKVLVSEVRKPGQDLTLTGKAPMSLILGAPAAVSISFNNEAVSLDEFPKGKVARFNLPRNG